MDDVDRATGQFGNRYRPRHGFRLDNFRPRHGMLGRFQPSRRFCVYNELRDQLAIFAMQADQHPLIATDLHNTKQVSVTNLHHILVSHVKFDRNHPVAFRHCRKFRQRLRRAVAQSEMKAEIDIGFAGGLGMPGRQRIRQGAAAALRRIIKDRRRAAKNRRQ